MLIGRTSIRFRTFLGFTSVIALMAMLTGLSVYRFGNVARTGDTLIGGVEQVGIANNFAFRLYELSATVNAFRDSKSEDDIPAIAQALETAQQAGVEVAGVLADQGDEETVAMLEAEQERYKG
ncbi:MAG: hypothetical protein RLN77_00990, partial [Rhodospirillales bacterium]